MIHAAVQFTRQVEKKIAPKDVKAHSANQMRRLLAGANSHAAQLRAINQLRLNGGL